MYGGPIESVAKLCEGLAENGQTVHVYTTTANGETELPVTPNETVLVDGVPVTYFTRITKDNSHVSPQLWRQLYRTCRSYDIVHIHSWWNPLVIVAAMICHARSVKVVVSPRGMLSEYIITSTNSLLKKIIHLGAGEKVLRKAWFHATSPIELDECRKLLPDWKGFMIPNLVTLPEVPVRKVKNEIFTLLFLSRIHPKKGIEFLLEALAKTDDMILKIAGTGEETYLTKLKQKIKQLGLESRVQWIGWKDRSEKFTELMKADLFVLISYNENFANSVIESLYVGTPVLVSDQVGLAPFVEEEQLGWVTALTTQAVAEKLQLIPAQPEKLEQIQQHSREAVDRVFSPKKLIDDYIAHYQSILSS